MRLPVVDGDDAKIAESATQEMVDYAMEQGINYYDTAWGFRFLQSVKEVTMADFTEKLKG